MWTIIGRIIWINVNWIEADFVLLDVRVLQRFRIVQVTTDLDPRLHPLFGPAIVSEVLLVFFERSRFDENAVVLKLLRPFVVKFYDEKDDAAHDGGEHVPPVGTVAAHLQRGPGQNDRDRGHDQDRGIHRPDRNVEKAMRPLAWLSIESQENVGGKKSAEEHH